jgi:hypothetical protein
VDERVSFGIHKYIVKYQKVNPMNVNTKNVMSLDKFRRGADPCMLIASIRKLIGNP